eukprot:103518-Pelagomonas_calceolata.AAC.1
MLRGDARTTENSTLFIPESSLVTLITFRCMLLPMQGLKDSGCVHMQTPKDGKGRACHEQKKKECSENTHYNID